MVILNFLLSAVSPFRLDLTVLALRRRDKNIIDFWDGTQYIRVFIFEGIPVRVYLEQIKDKPQVKVTAHSQFMFADLKDHLSSLLNKMFGLKLDLREFYKLAEKDKYLRSLSSRFIGVKPPRFPSLFEALVNAIACQQVSLESGISLLNRLAQHYGKRFQAHDQLHYSFPERDIIKDCTIEDLKKLGFSFNKSRTLTELANIMSSQESLFSKLESASNEEVIRQLSYLKGIGRWSTEYALLRGLGRVEIFPNDDIGAQRNLRSLLSLNDKIDYIQTKAITEKWQPYAGFVYFHLLLQKLFEKNTQGPF